MNFTIYNLLARLLPTVTVDKAVKGLSKFAKALEAAEAAQSKRAAELRTQANALRVAAVRAEDEAARAARVRSNILTLTA